LLVNGTVVDTVDFSSAIDSGQTLRGSLEANVLLRAGPNEVAIEMTRPWLNSGGYAASPLALLDDVQVRAVPEPSVASFGIFALSISFCWKRVRKWISGG
jgi:hypothetical protein